MTACSSNPAGHFNPRSPHGERQNCFGACWSSALSFQSTLPARGATTAGLLGWGLAQISIHAPCTGSDHRHCNSSGASTAFQSTLPARGATSSIIAAANALDISIHAPRTGSDTASSGRRRWQPYFNPRSPHGERRTRIPVCSSRRVFQSTLPARGATWTISPCAVNPR